MKVRFNVVTMSLLVMSFAAFAWSYDRYLPNVYYYPGGDGDCLDYTDGTSEETCGGIAHDCSDEPQPPSGSPVGIDCGTFVIPSGLVKSFVKYSDSGFGSTHDMKWPPALDCVTTGNCRTKEIDGEVRCERFLIEYSFFMAYEIDPEQPCPGLGVNPTSPIRPPVLEDPVLE